MKNRVFCGHFLESSKPYFAMISLQFGYAGMIILSKMSLNGGMSHYVLVVYRHAIATAAIAPFALIFERRRQPKITFPVFVQIFILALLGPVIDQNFYYAGLKFTSSTFSCAMGDTLPAMTFVLAVFCRMEKIDMKKVTCQAKVVGTVLAVAGAMLMTLYKGQIVKMFWSKYIHLHNISQTDNAAANANQNQYLGSILLTIGNLAWASFFIVQAKALKTYKDHQFSLTAMVCFVGTLQAIVVTLVMEHKPSTWRPSKVDILAAAYSGIVASSISYYVQGFVINKKGPVFATAFSPLTMIIVAVMGSFILAEKIYLGGVIGAILILIGLSAVLWGKHKESKEKELADVVPEPVTCVQGNGNTGLMIEDIEVSGIELHKGEVNKISAVAVSMPIPEPIMKTNQMS